MSKTTLHLLLSFYFVFGFLLQGVSQYQIKHFTTENGLSSNGIKGIQWDSATGFLWIATEAGLARYNGMAFKTFDVVSNPELGSNRIVMLVKNKEGKILVAGEDGNLSIVKNNGVSLYFNGSEKAKYNFSYYAAIAASDTLFRQCFKTPWTLDVDFFFVNVFSVSDSLCLVMGSRALYYYSVTTRQPERIRSVPQDIKTIFAVDGHLYYCDYRNRLFSYHIGQDEIKEEILQDADGSRFVLQNENAKIFWQTGLESPVLIQDGNAWLIERDYNGQLKTELIGSGIPENSFFNFVQYEKKSGFLVLGTASKGIYIVRQQHLKTLQPAEININQRNSFYSQVELPDGNILTNEGSILGNKPSEKHGFSLPFINDVFSLNDSMLIYASRDSIISYDKKKNTHRLLFNEAVNQHFSIVKSGNQLYFADQNGIAVLNSNGKPEFITSTDSKEKVHFSVFNMIESEPGQLLLATCKGLLRFDTKSRIFDTLLNLNSVCIRALQKVEDYIFIGTYGGGYYVMKGNKLKAMPLDNNQYLKYAHCFMQDDAGYCWMSSNNGLFKAKVSDITAAFENGSQQIYYHYLGKEDGMQITEMNGGCTPCALRLSSGFFSFPTMDGLVWVNPKTQITALPAGEIFIDKLMVDGKEQRLNGTVPINFSQRVKKIDFTFVTNAWGKKENLYLGYKLNDGDWMPVDIIEEEPRISFTNVRYGNYTLTIRKLNGFGKDNYTYTTIAFSVATPFYQQWGFRILAAGILASLIYFIYRLRVRQFLRNEKKLSLLVEEKTKDLQQKNLLLEKNDEVKTRLISVINHDIITPLKFMHYAGNAVVEKKGNMPMEEQLNTVADITQTAREMEMLSSQILNWIIYQNPSRQMQREDFDLHQLTETVFRALRFPAKQNNTKLINEVPPHFVIYQFLEPLRVLIYNLILNSVNFTKDGTVTVQCSLNANGAEILVTDSGIGMTEDQIRNLQSQEDRIIASANVDNKKGTGLGYMIIKDLLKILKGSIAVKSVKGNGTTVAVILKLIQPENS